MPTKPVDGILDRDFAAVIAKPLIDVAGPLLEEIVNYSINLLVRSDASSKAGKDVDLALMSLFHSSITQLDGIHALLVRPAALAAEPVMRSHFEATMQIHFLVSDPALYQQRALSWVVFRIHEQLRIHRILDKSTQEGAEFFRNKTTDWGGALAKTDFYYPLADSEKKRLKSVLSEPHLQHYVREFQRKKYRWWFQMFGGPPSLKELANQVGMGTWYEIEYRKLSRIAHGIEDLAYEKSPDGGKVFRGLHGNLEDLRSVAFRAALHGVHNIRMVVRQMRPGENIRNWYLKEIRERMQSLKRPIQVEKEQP